MWKIWKKSHDPSIWIYYGPRHSIKPPAAASHEEAGPCWALLIKQGRSVQNPVVHESCRAEDELSSGLGYLAYLVRMWQSRDYLQKHFKAFLSWDFWNSLLIFFKAPGWGLTERIWNRNERGRGRSWVNLTTNLLLLSYIFYSINISDIVSATLLFWSQIQPKAPTTASGRKHYVVGLSVHMLLHTPVSPFILFVWTWWLKNRIFFKFSVIVQCVLNIRKQFGGHCSLKNMLLVLWTTCHEHYDGTSSNLKQMFTCTQRWTDLFFVVKGQGHNTLIFVNTHRECHYIWQKHWLRPKDVLIIIGQSSRYPTKVFFAWWTWFKGQ